MYIERQMSGTLRCVMDEYPIVTVSGPRQSGKTTLVRKCLERVGTDPAKRAFYGAFCDFSPLNDLGELAGSDLIATGTPSKARQN